MKTAPKTKKIFVPFNKNNIAAEQSLNDLQTVAAIMKIKLIVKEIKTIKELKKAVINMPLDIDAVWLLHSHFLVSKIDIIFKEAIKRKIPISTATSQYKFGALLSYGQNQFHTGKKAGRLAIKILNGTPIRDLPVEMTDYYLSINLNIAKKIGLRIPKNVLIQADNIIR